MGSFWLVVAAIVCLAAEGESLRAEEFRVEEVPSATAVAPAEMRLGMIAFSDQRNDKLADPVTGLIRFEDWERARPQQKGILSLFPGYEEPRIEVSVHGVKRPYTEKLHMYVVEARFLIGRAPDAIDLTRYTRLDVLEKIDPAIQHHQIGADQARPDTDPESAHNRHPSRRWCDAPQSLCIQSRYPLEGKLPVGIRLANKLEEGGKQIADFIEFQTELRVLQLQEIDQAGFSTLTALEAPVTGVLEQTVFSVNQVMQFGKLVTVLQKYPNGTDKTVATVFLALAVETDVLERKKEFENVPVLRNLIPSQVLMGKSSFNVGNSISAGLPAYSRNRIRAIASLLER
jgi:hypothetical protein